MNTSNSKVQKSRPKSKVYHDIYCKHHGLVSIPQGYCIHHINGDPTDQSIDNLQLMTLGEHSIIHHTGNKYCLGRVYTQETKDKMAESRRGQPGWNIRKITIEMIEDQPFMNARVFIKKYNCGIRIYYIIKKLLEVVKREAE
jgi:hypothetical protein